MAGYTRNEYLDMVLLHRECHHNAAAAVRRYANDYPHRRQPSVPVVLGAVRRLHENGDVMPNRGNGGRPRLQADEIEEEVLRIFNENPRDSTRCVAGRLGVPHTTVWRILNENNLYPYHFTRVHGLRPGDDVNRRSFCNWLIARHQQGANFFERILFTDEAGFGRCGAFNIHNEHEWGNRDDRPFPVIVNRRHQHLFHLNVWLGVFGNKIVSNFSNFH